ncbi:hypothetical protein [Streptomyces sp. NPDC091046]|uniref:hypothetical protein n=1 Tax=Streptomyces sp. NPDC091046 TaxID=3365973 RepID=UPI00380B6155
MTDHQPDSYETGRTYSAAEISRSVKQQTATGRLQAALLAEFERFERERRAEIIAAGGDPDEDRDPFEHVRVIADQWSETADDSNARAAFLDRLAQQLDTSAVRALRLAAEAAAAITPRLIQADADAGVRAADTADDLGVTESYVYRVRREQRAATGDDGDPNTLCMDYHPESDLKWSARCQMSQGHSAPRHRGEGTDGTAYDWPVNGYEISTRRAAQQ